MKLLKQQRKTLLQGCRHLTFATPIEDDSTFAPHPQGGIIVIHPSHPPRWLKPDGTEEEIKPCASVTQE
jgi:hypothetical protein